MARRPLHEVGVERRLDKVPKELTKIIQEVSEATKPWPLFIWGPAGTGKTCAALCVLDYCGGVYYTATRLCSAVIESQNGRLVWYHEGRSGVIYPESFWKRIETGWLTVLDEIGCRDRVTDHQYECVKRFIDSRQGRPAIYLSNLSLEQIEKVYDDRIASRLASGTVFNLSGKDQRLPS